MYLQLAFKELPAHGLTISLLARTSEKTTPQTSWYLLLRTLQAKSVGTKKNKHENSAILLREIRWQQNGHKAHATIFL